MKTTVITRNPDGTVNKQVSEQELGKGYTSTDCVAPFNNHRPEFSWSTQVLEEVFQAEDFQAST